jgi:hypothetical protein
MTQPAYKFRHSNIDKKRYCENLQAEAALVQREIDKLTVKREMLMDFALRLEMDLVDGAGSPAVSEAV